MRYYYLIFLTISLLGCVSHNDYFPAVKHLNGQEIFLSENFSYNHRMTVSDTLLVIADNKNNPMIFVYTLPSFKLIANFGNKGNGPGELLSTTGISIDSLRQIWVYDFYKTEFLAFNLTTGMPVNSLKMPEEERQPLVPFANFISDREYAVYRADAVDGTGIFQLFRDGKCIKALGNLPERDKNIPPIAFAQVYSGLSKYDDRLKKMAIAYLRTSKIDIVDMVTDSIFTIYGEIFFESIYAISNNGTFTITENTVFAYQDIDTDDQYIYVSYKGNGLKDPDPMEIHVYDWKGNPVCKYKLSHQVAGFSVDRKNKRIYTTSSDTEYNPVIYNIDL